MRRLLVVLALLVPLVGCEDSPPAGDRGGAAASKARYFHVPTEIRNVRRPAELSRLEGVLSFTANGCPSLVADNGQHHWLAFPVYSRGVATEKGTRSVVDNQGFVFATEGDPVHFAGSAMATRPVKHPCRRVEEADYFSVQQQPSSRRVDLIQQRWSSRTPLPSCGRVTITHGQVLKDVATQELACMEKALKEGVGRELFYEFPTIEGDPIRIYYRTTPRGEFEVYVDSTADNYGSRRWNYFRCDSIADYGRCP